MKRRLAAVWLLASPAAALAQICNGGMSYDECSAALNTALAGGREEILGAARATVDAELQTLNTGSQSDSSSSTQDFNPKLQASIDALGLGDSDGSAITVSWNDFFRDILKRTTGGNVNSVGQHHKLQIRLEEASVYEPLTELIDDQVALDAFSNELNDFDNISLDFKFSLNSASRGRDLAQSENLLLVDAIQRESLDQVSTLLDTTHLLLNERNTVLRQAVDRGVNFDSTIPMNEFLSPAETAALIQAAESARAAQLEYGAAYNNAARANGLFKLVELANNQPQLILAVKGSVRDDLVGPNDLTVSFSYEFGGVNINDYREYSAEQRRQDASRTSNWLCSRMTESGLVASEASCLQSFVAANSGTIEEGNRLALSIDYIEKESYDFNRSGYSLMQDSERSLVARFTYGRYLDMGFAEEIIGGRSRLDVSMSYENVGDDPARDDRALANITLSQEISPGLFLTLGIQWANKPEYRAMSDEDLTARAGISYKLARSQ